MKKLALTDFYNYTFLSGLTFSPDKSKALLMTKKCDKENNGYKSNLWLFTPADKKVKPLTSAGDVGNFTWLNDEEIIFTAMRDPALKNKVAAGETWTSVYKLALGGGEAEEYFRLPEIVTGIKVLDDENFVLTISNNSNRPDIESMEGDEKAKALAKQKADKDYEVVDELPFWGNGMGFTNGKRSEIHLFNKNEGKLKPVSVYPLSSRVADVKDGKILYIVSDFVKVLQPAKTVCGCMTSKKVKTKNWLQKTNGPSAMQALQVWTKSLCRQLTMQNTV